MRQMWGLALCRCILGNLLAYGVYRHFMMGRSNSDQFLYSATNVEYCQWEAYLPWVAQHTDDVGLCLTEFKHIVSICDQPRLGKGGLIVTTEQLLYRAEGVEGKPNVPQFSCDGQLHDIAKAITPVGVMACLRTSEGWYNEARTRPGIETLKGDTGEPTGFPSAKGEDVVYQLHMWVLSRCPIV